MKTTITEDGLIKQYRFDCNLVPITQFQTPFSRDALTTALRKIIADPSDDIPTTHSYDHAQFVRVESQIHIQAGPHFFSLTLLDAMRLLLEDA